MSLVIYLTFGLPLLFFVWQISYRLQQLADHLYFIRIQKGHPISRKEDRP
jgi:hypothetical protein